MSNYGVDTDRDISDLLSTEEVGRFNVGGFRAFEPPEESLPHVIRHMNAARTWDWLMGIVAILQNTTQGLSQNTEQGGVDGNVDLSDTVPLWQSGSPGEGWEAAMGLPTLEHMVEMMRGIEAAYVQGLSSTPMSMDKDNLNEYFADALLALKPLIDDDMVHINDKVIRVTPRGNLFIRIICMCFDAHLQKQISKTRFSRVI